MSTPLKYTFHVNSVQQLCQSSMTNFNLPCQSTFWCTERNFGALMDDYTYFNINIYSYAKSITQIDFSHILVNQIVS